MNEKTEEEIISMIRSDIIMLKRGEQTENVKERIHLLEQFCDKPIILSNDKTIFVLQKDASFGDATLVLQKDANGNKVLAKLRPPITPEILRQQCDCIFIVVLIC